MHMLQSCNNCLLRTVLPPARVCRCTTLPGAQSTDCSTESMEQRRGTRPTERMKPARLPRYSDTVRTNDAGI